jgi:hypothetical protein
MGFRQDSSSACDINVRPTPEQVEEALNRVLTNEDGTQTLDGYYFPPDNNEPFHPRTIAYKNVTTGETKQFESTFPNNEARKANLNLAALGYGPLFIREDDPKHIQLMKEWKERGENYRSPIQRLLLRALDWS